jgi:riboflavin synthase
MFTGIVQGLGVLGERQGTVLEVHVPAPMATRLAKGASIAVNGVCLTVRELRGESFLADLSQETASRTTLGQLHAGARVNLELPVSPNGFLDGHLVLGHVDAVGRVKAIRRGTDEWQFIVAYPPQYRDHLVEKGSVAVDGISLTPFSITGTTFQCAIVPHTFSETNLSKRAVGDAVNLEFDILGKYVAEAIARDHAN